MGTSFDIVLSRPLDPEEVTDALVQLLPLGLRIGVRRTVDELPDEPGAFRAIVVPTQDPDWPCSLNCLACGDECALGAYPELRVADWLSRRLGVDCLCDTYPFVGDLDPHNPYWWLACIRGEWYLADASGSRLMGPYTDGSQTFPGDEPVRLVRAVTLPEGVRIPPA
jgi:hypothetical protein